MPAILLVAGEQEPVPSPLPVGFPAEAYAALERVGPQARAQFAASIPGARLITVPDATHYIQTQRPDVELVRRGLARSRPAAPFVQRTCSGHALLDVSDVAEVLDVLDGTRCCPKTRPSSKSPISALVTAREDMDLTELFRCLEH